MATCPYCQSTVEDNNPGLLCERIDEELKGSWHFAESDSKDRWGWPVGQKFDIDGVGAAEVVAKKILAMPDEMEIGYYEGGKNLPQGSTFEAYVVLKIGEHFFKKTGEGDSYSDISWTGPVKPVTPKTETRVVYTFG